ncbi:MAG: alanyl-tRNA editing protein [Aristaeellaceae bacterium]
MTIRLFDQDVNMLDFTARVLACDPAGDEWDVVLDRTAFFPEGGGQGADHGLLGDARVLDAHEKDGVVLHRTDAPLTVGDTVEGHVEAERRLSMMQQHTGEHILSGLICRLYGYHNVGFHIGTEAVTLDFNGPLTEAQALEAERLANECVWRDQPVRAWIPEKEELANLGYRSKKAIDGDVRIVSIDGVDTCACCGTHVPTTGMVGQIKVISVQKYKGGVRLSILCGMRALAMENQLLEENRAVSQALSAKQGELAAAVQRTIKERDDLRYRCEQLGMQLFASRAEALRQQPVRVLEGEMLSPAQLRKAAGLLAEGGRYGLVLLKKDGGWSFALCAPEADARTAAQTLNARFGGKSGGPRDMVQGVLAGGEPAEMQGVLEGL